MGHYTGRRERPRIGFTLVELLVVIAIIGILVALLLPAIQAAREAARRAQCLNNIKQLALGMHLYHDGHGKLPAGSPWDNEPGPHNGQRPGPNWAAALLPYIEEQPLYNQFDFKVPLPHPNNADEVATVVPGFICPSDEDGSQPIMDRSDGKGSAVYAPVPKRAMGAWYTISMGPTADGTTPGQTCVFCPKPKNFQNAPDSYCCQGWTFGTDFPPGNSVGMFGRYKTAFKFREVTDGLSKTWMMGETLPQDCTLFNTAYSLNFCIAGTTIPLNTFADRNRATQYWTDCGFKSRHPGGAVFALGDASVRFVDQTIDYRLYNEVGTRAGDETATLE